MPASYAKGIRLQRVNDITLKREGQMIKTLRLLTNFISLALFGTKHFRSDVRFFLKSEFRKNAVSSLNEHNNPISIQLPAGVLFLFIFFYWLFTVCKLPVLDNKILSNSDYQRMGCVCDNHLSLMGSLVSWLRIFERWKKLRAVTCVKVTAYKTSFEKCSN